MVSEETHATHSAPDPFCWKPTGATVDVWGRHDYCWIACMVMSFWPDAILRSLRVPRGEVEVVTAARAAKGQGVSKLYACESAKAVRYLTRPSLRPPGPSSCRWSRQDPGTA